MCTGWVQFEFAVRFLMVQISAVPRLMLWSDRLGSKVLPLMLKLRPAGAVGSLMNSQVLVFAIGMWLMSGYWVNVAGTRLGSGSAPPPSLHSVTSRLSTARRTR